MDFFDILSIASGPIIGMIIGYFTNLLAVRMLFRPLYPKKIGKWQLPFTPGVIPKRQGALAAALGSAVEEQLFTPEDLQAAIGNERVKNALADRVVAGLSVLTAERNVGETLQIVMGEERYVEVRDLVFEKALTTICENVEEMDLGTIIGNEVKDYVETFVAGNSLLGLVMTKDRIARIADQFAERLETFISENIELIIAPRLAGEIEKIEMYSLDPLPISEAWIRNTVGILFEMFTAQALPALISNIPIAEIVADKIRAMDPRDLEKLVLSVLKKELGAVVRLGAVLGFLIGILNIFI